MISNLEINEGISNNQYVYIKDVIVVVNKEAVLNSELYFFKIKDYNP